MKKILFTILCLISLSLHSASGPTYHRAVYIDNGQGTSPFIKAGIWRGAKHISDSLMVDELAEEIYTLHAGEINGSLDGQFDPVIYKISQFIEQEAPKNSEKNNGHSNLELATRITKVGMCFGIDPYMLTAKIFMETRFDRKRVSGTGAVGFTQMTSVGIDEVNDQLGNRGGKYAPSANAAKFRAGIKCYYGDEVYDGVFRTMWESKTIDNGATASSSSDTRASAKAWLGRNTGRDLIYGAILMKTYLAAEFKLDRSLDEQYKNAFKRYNGDSSSVSDATIQTLTSILSEFGQTFDVDTTNLNMSTIYSEFGLQIFDYIRTISVSEQPQYI